MYATSVHDLPAAYRLSHRTSCSALRGLQRFANSSCWSGRQPNQTSSTIIKTTYLQSFNNHALEGSVSYGFRYMKRTLQIRLSSMAVQVVPKPKNLSSVSYDYFTSEHQHQRACATKCASILSVK